MGNEAVTPAPTCWVSAEPRRTEGERSPREGSGGGGGGGAHRAAPPAAHALRPPARCGRLPRRPCRERPPVRGRWWARRAPLRRPRGAAGMRGAGRRSRAPRAAAFGLALLLLASCVQVGGRRGGGGAQLPAAGRRRRSLLLLPAPLPPCAFLRGRCFLAAVFRIYARRRRGVKPEAGESWRVGWGGGGGSGEPLAAAAPRSLRCPRPR